MKKKSVGILLGMLVFATCFGGCDEKNEASKAAEESIETEKEGTGEATEDEEAEKEEAAAVTVSQEKVGILLPESSYKWNEQGLLLQNQLIEAGYTAQTFFAAADEEKQIEQLEELIEEDAKALVIVPVNTYALTEVLEKAEEKSIPVISYTDLIMNTDAVSYYVTFDTRAMGHAVAEHIVKEKNLEKALDNSEFYNIEFVMGTPDDQDELFFFNGIMEVLQPYFDSGVLVSQSGQITFDETAIMDRSQSAAEERIQNLTEEFYQGTETLDILCTASDSYVYAYMEELVKNDILPGEEEWPLITGIGCEAKAVKKIAEGALEVSIFMDEKELAEECLSVLKTLLSGEDPEVENYEQYDNGTKLIRTFTNEGQQIDKDNYQMLIDKGYYTAQEVEPEVTPTPTPTIAPTATPTVEPTATPEPTITPTAATTMSPIPVAEITVTPTIKP